MHSLNAFKTLESATAMGCRGGREMDNFLCSDSADGQFVRVLCNIYYMNYAICGVCYVLCDTMHDGHHPAF